MNGPQTRTPGDVPGRTDADAILASWVAATERRPPPFTGPGESARVSVGRIARAATVVALGAVVVAGSLVALSAEQARRADLAAARADLVDQQLRLGDPVVASGLLFTDDAGKTFAICVPRFERPAPRDEQCLQRTIDDQPTGPVWSVPVVGIRPEEVPGLTVGGSAWDVTVYGQWLGDAIGADAVVGGVPPGPTRFALPCPEPPGGWPTGPPTGAGGDKALFRLQKEIEAHPTLYSGLWRSYPGGLTTRRYGAVVFVSVASASGPAGTVLTVGTVGDVEVVQRRLAGIFPYPICVTKARYGAAELSAVAVRLGTPDQTWVARVEPDIDRVRVSLTFADGAAVERIGDDAGKVVLEPLVRRVARAILSEDDAVERALAQYPGLLTEVTWTRIGRAVDLDPGVRPPSAYALVWGIGLRGSFGDSCPPAHPTPPGATAQPCTAMTHAAVYLDAVTGQPLSLTLSGP